MKKCLSKEQATKLAKLAKLQGEFMTKVCEIIEDKEAQIALTNKIGEFTQIETEYIMK